MLTRTHIYSLLRITNDSHRFYAMFAILTIDVLLSMLQISQW